MVYTLIDIHRMAKFLQIINARKKDKMNIIFEDDVYEGNKANMLERLKIKYTLSIYSR